MQKQKIFRFLYSATVDMKANDKEEAKQKFEEMNLFPKGHKFDFRDLLDDYEIDKFGIRRVKDE
jgi:hypothetical protein